MRGMGLLPMETVFAKKKTRTQVQGKYLDIQGEYEPLSGVEFTGYEIHMGESTWKSGAKASTWTKDSVSGKEKTEGTVYGNVCGTYVHGIFDREESALALIRAVGEKRGSTFLIWKGWILSPLKKLSMIFLQQSFENILILKKSTRFWKRE